MPTIATRPAGEPSAGSTPLAPSRSTAETTPFDPADPASWRSLGRSAEHATALADVWRRFPDLPAAAPLADRMARGRERIAAMRPVNDAISLRTEAERQATNFGFVAAKAATGEIDDRDLAILRGRDDHGYDWDRAVAYADGWYAAHAGWPYRKRGDDCAGSPAAASARGDAYDVGFAAAGGNGADLFDVARRENLAALRADNQPATTSQRAPARPLPSSWPKPTDHPRPSRWSRRLLVISDLLTVETTPGAFRPAALSDDLVRALPRLEVEGLAVVTLGAAGFSAGYAGDRAGPALSSARADAIIADPAHLATLRELVDGREFDDVLIAAQGEYLRVVDAFAIALPLARTMERTRNSVLLQRSQLRCWLDRGRGKDQNSGAGHIRWGKAIKGLVGKLGEFTARHAGPAPGRGYLIRVELASGDLARGYVTSTGEMLVPEIVAANKARLRRDITAALRAFGGATRLA